MKTISNPISFDYKGNLATINAKASILIEGGTREERKQVLNSIAGELYKQKTVLHGIASKRTFIQGKGKPVFKTLNYEEKENIKQLSKIQKEIAGRWVFLKRTGTAGYSIDNLPPAFIKSFPHTVIIVEDINKFENPDIVDAFTTILQLGKSANISLIGTINPDIEVVHKNIKNNIQGNIKLG